VAWDEVTKKFTIKENGSELDAFHLQWQTGDNAPAAVGGAGESIGEILGFDALSDDVHTAIKSTRGVEWGIFTTLVDLKQYLSDNDRDGIERSLGRLEADFDNMTSKIVDTGMKYSRLEVRETITRDVGLSLDQRRSMIEDADIIEAIMNLQGIQTAYQAALASTSQVLNISLVDYLR
jgi:flagellar hook-associated protein 3 FlgL